MPDAAPARRLLSLLRARSTFAAVSHGLAANIIVALANLATGIVLARALGAEGRGYLAALIALPSLLPAFLTLGLPTTATFELRTHPRDAGQMMGFAVAVGLAMSALGAIAAMLIAPHFLDKLPGELREPAVLLAGLTFPSVLITYLLAGLQAREEFGAFNAIRYLHPLLVLLATALLASTHALTPVTAALVVLSAGIPGLAWCGWWLVRSFRLSTSWSRATIARWLGYSVRVYTTDLLLAASTQIDKFIVVAVFAASMLGSYTVILNLSRLVGMFSSAVAIVLFPKASGRALPEVVDMTSRAAGATLLVALGLALPLLLFGRFLLRTVYGPEFDQGYLALQILVVEAIVASLAQVLSQAFLALNRPGLVSLQYFVGLAVAAPLLLVLAPRFGAQGAALALLAASCARLAAIYSCFAVGLGTRAPRIWPGVYGAMQLARRMLELAHR
jgi:O-antigen/teichoic acid export membrane protein